MKSVDIAAWDRKEIYDLFSACDHPFYSVSFELDVTNLYAHTHESGLSFYYSLCYLMTRAMEEVEAFRMRIRDGRIDIVDELIPSCTDLVPGSDAFVIVTLPHGGDMAEFCRQAKEKAAGQMYLFDREMEKLDTLVYFSCLPWFPVTGCSELLRRTADPFNKNQADARGRPPDFLLKREEERMWMVAVAARWKPSPVHGGSREPAPSDGLIIPEVRLRLVNSL